MANQRNVLGGLLPGTWFEYQDVWQLGSQESFRSGHSVACVGSGNDQTNAYVGEYATYSRTGRSCVGTAVDGITALVGGIVEVSLIAKPSYKFLMYINQLFAMPAKHKSSVTQPQSVLCVLYFGTNLTQLFL